MKRGFLSSIAGIGLVALLLLATVINIWQRNNTERRLIELTSRLGELERKLEGGGFSSGPAAASGEPAYITQALQDPSNFLERDPNPWQPAGAEKGGTLYLHFGSDPKGFNWLLENGADVTEVQEFVHMPLIHRHRDDVTKWGPELAYYMAIDEKEDGSITYRFKLREDVYWHEPQVDWASGEYDWLRGDHLVTAKDVEFFMDLLMNKQVTKAAPLRSYYEEDLVDYGATGKFEFQITFKRKVFSQMAVAIPSMYPMPEFLYRYDEDGSRIDDELLGQKFDNHFYNPLGLGCGAYKLVEVEQGVKVVLERNPRHVLDNNAFDKVVYRILGDQNQPPRMLRTGELHLAYLQPGQYRTEYLEGSADSPFKNGQLDAGDWWEHSYFYIGWNMRKPIFREKAVRRAMSHAFNADKLLQDVFMGLGERNTGPMPAFLPWYDRSVPPIPFDLARAGAILDEAGWVDSNSNGIRDKTIDGVLHELEFSLMSYGSSDEYRTVGNIFKEDLKKIGVKMTPTPMEWSNLLKKVNDREFDAVTLAWVSSPDVDFNQIWHSSQADEPKSSNHVGFKNAEADAIIEEMAVTFDTAKRKELASRFHRLVAEEQPYTFFYTRKRPGFWQKQLNNVVFSKTRPYRNHKAWYLSAAN